MKRNFYTRAKGLIRFANFKNVLIPILLLFLLIPLSLTAQETVVVGQVMNSKDKSPIPFVNITFKNSNAIVQSNEEGYFIIRDKEKHTTLEFTSIGFTKREIRIKPGQSVGLQIEMQEGNTLLQEVFVVPAWHRRYQFRGGDGGVACPIERRRPLRQTSPRRVRL